MSCSQRPAFSAELKPQGGGGSPAPPPPAGAVASPVAGFSPAAASAPARTRLWNRYGWLACFVPIALIPVLAGRGVPLAVARGLGLLGFALLGWVSGWLHPSLVALLILLLMPFLGLASFEEALVGYGQPFVWLFVSTFVIAAAMETTGLGRRIALTLLRRARGRSSTTVLALFGAACVLGFMVPTTAGRSAVLFPLCSSLVRAVGGGGSGGAGGSEEQAGSGNLARAIFLGVGFVSINTAWAVMTASTSAVYTAGAMVQLAGYRWSYLTWLLASLPILVLFVLGLWYWLLRLYPPGFREVPGGVGYLNEELARLGRMRGGELRTVALLAVMVGLWLSEPYHHLSVPLVGLATAVALCVPGLGVVGWQQALRQVSWDVIIQFGAAYALTRALASSGTGQWLAEAVAGLFPSMPPLGAAVLVITVVTLIRLGFANMLAMVSMFLPIAVELARAWNLNPVWLAHVALIAAGFAFFLPAQTPTTAMAYGYGYFTVQEMRQAGFRALLLAGSLTVAFALLLWPRLGIPAGRS